MPRVRDLLYRLRPAGAPGAASTAGVPADRRADLAAELEPLFAQLATTEQECTAAVVRARTEAEDIRARSAERARRIVSEAEERASAERAAAAAQARGRAGDHPAEALLAARREAAQLRDRAIERMPAYVAEVVASVCAVMGGDRPVERPGAST